MTDRDRAIGIDAVIATASAICSGDRAGTFQLLVHAIGRMAEESTGTSQVLTVAIDALSGARDRIAEVKLLESESMS